MSFSSKDRKNRSCRFFCCSTLWRLSENGYLFPSHPTHRVLPPLLFFMPSLFTNPMTRTGVPASQTAPRSSKPISVARPERCSGQGAVLLLPSVLFLLISFPFQSGCLAFSRFVSPLWSLVASTNWLPVFRVNRLPARIRCLQHKFAYSERSWCQTKLFYLIWPSQVCWVIPDILQCEASRVTWIPRGNFVVLQENTSCALLSSVSGSPDGGTFVHLQMVHLRPCHLQASHSMLWRLPTTVSPMLFFHAHGKSGIRRDWQLLVFSGGNPKIKWFVGWVFLVCLFFFFPRSLI